MDFPGESTQEKLFVLLYKGSGAQIINVIWAFFHVEQEKPEIVSECNLAALNVDQCLHGTRTIT